VASTESDVIVFVAPGGGSAGGPLGAEQDYGKMRDYFERRKEDVAMEWDRLCEQMQELLDRVSVTVTDFEFHSVEFELGFSAEGHLGFIAKAGANGTVRVTFQRKP
jgi:hypothetical protein